MEHLVLHYGLMVAALMIFLTELGIPTGVPNELILLLTGAYAIHSVPGLLAGFIAVTAADVLGSTALFWATGTGGLWIATRVLAKMGRTPEDTFQRWRERLGGHDVLVIIVGRLLPVVRMSVAVGAGLLRVDPRDFVIGVIPGGMLWAGVPLVLGYLFSSHVHRLIHAYQHVTHIMLMALPAIIMVAFAVWLVRKRVRQSGRARAESLRR